MPEDSREVRKDSLKLGGFDKGAALNAGRYAWRLSRRLRQLAPDLVHTNSLKSALYGGIAGRLAGIPVVWHIRDRIADDYLPGPAVRGVRLAAHIVPSAVIANSRTTLDTLPALRRGAVVANAVVRDTTGHLPAFLELQDGPCRIGLIGRFASWKGQHIFLEAFAGAFPSGGVEAWLIGEAIFGESDYVAQLHQQVERLGLADRVVFRGFRENIWEELAQLHILVHSSVTPEPFGQVIIEGMAAGVPVIATNAGGPAEIITDGTDGLLVPPGDVTAMGHALQRLESDPELRRSLSRAGMKTVTRYRPERTAKEVMAVYERVLSRRR
jgi:glycosyltransferase involved in cell wall biosynthesis